MDNLKGLNVSVNSYISSANTWYKLVKIPSTEGVFGFNGILSIRATSGGTVMYATFVIIASHDRTVSCAQLASCGYTQFSLRFFVSYAGDLLIEINNNVRPSSQTSMPVKCQLVALDGVMRNIEVYKNEISEDVYNNMVLRSSITTSYNKIVESSFV